MRFRLGVVVGFAAGYYLGARAGRERYVQLEAWLERVRDTASYHEARTKLTDGWREGTTYARRLLDERGDAGEPAGRDDEAYADDPTGDEDRPRPLRDLFGDPTLN